MSAVGSDGTTWAVRVGEPSIPPSSPHGELALALRITPRGGDVTSFRRRYGVIVDELFTHRATLAIRRRWDAGVVGTRPHTLGVYEVGRREIGVEATNGSWWRGFSRVTRLGVAHIFEGPEHVLFLLMLLIPAPLLVRAGRWTAGGSGLRSIGRIVHVVTAFAVGHSLTLAARR